MILSPEIRFQSISVQDLQSLAEDLQRALPKSTVTPVNQRGRPADWRSGKVAALRLKSDDRKKAFMILSMKEATIAPQHSDPDTLAMALSVLSGKLELRQDEEAATGLLCTTGFLAVLGFIIAERAAPQTMVMVGVLVIGLLLLVVGLLMFGVRGRNTPCKGVSRLSLLFILPGLLMMAPLSLLNLPLMNYLRRFHGSRLLDRLA